MTVIDGTHVIYGVGGVVANYLSCTAIQLDIHVLMWEGRFQQVYCYWFALIICNEHVLAMKCDSDDHINASHVYL